MDRTIDDFGAQWTRYPENDGYYASHQMLADICGPLMDPATFHGQHVADIGSGSGRIARMLLEAGARRVTAVEPSAAHDVLVRNLADQADRVTFVRAHGDQLPDAAYDIIVSFGVLHHIPEPEPVAKRMFDCLRPGGQALIWLYGREGNGLYLSLFLPLRAVTRLLPDAVLSGLCHVLTAFLTLYVWACRILPLPMRAYMCEVIGRYPWRHRFLTVFDQLNPSYARYYTEVEARALLEDAGFADVALYHRHGYSWTVFGRKPNTV